MIVFLGPSLYCTRSSNPSSIGVVLVNCSKYELCLTAVLASKAVTRALLCCIDLAGISVAAEPSTTDAIVEATVVVISILMKDPLYATLVTVCLYSLLCYTKTLI